MHGRSGDVRVCEFCWGFPLKKLHLVELEKVSYTSDLMILFLFCELDVMLGDALDLKGETTSEKKRKQE